MVLRGLLCAIAKEQLGQDVPKKKKKKENKPPPGAALLVYLFNIASMLRAARLIRFTSLQCLKASNQSLENSILHNIFF